MDKESTYSWVMEYMHSAREDTLRIQRKTTLIARKLAHYRTNIAALSKTWLIEEGLICGPEAGHTFLLKGKTGNKDSCHAVVFSTYENLNSLVKSTPAIDKLIVLGDFNTRVGFDYESWKGILGQHGLGKLNKMTWSYSQCVLKTTLVSSRHSSDLPTSTWPHGCTPGPTNDIWLTMLLPVGWTFMMSRSPEPWEESSVGLITGWWGLSLASNLFMCTIGNLNSLD